MTNDACRPDAERSVKGKTLPETCNKLHPENGEATAAHARQPGELVAWAEITPDGYVSLWTADHVCSLSKDFHGRNLRPLYTHPAPPQAQDFAKGAEAMRVDAAKLVRDAKGAFGSINLAEKIMALPLPTQPAGEG